MRALKKRAQLLEDQADAEADAEAEQPAPAP
jgi:hypothetical protein